MSGYPSIWLIGTRGSGVQGIRATRKELGRQAAAEIGSRKLRHQAGINNTMKNIIVAEIIEQKIFLIRGHKVMLDKDLAVLYGIKPIRLREQVKRNIQRFPDDFMLQLNDEEIDSMVSHNAIPSRKYLGGYRPYVFTEQGVAMLSSVNADGISSEQAMQENRDTHYFKEIRNLAL